jgi:D-alanyl-D-alanine carboxypeptidase
LSYGRYARRISALVVVGAVLGAVAAGAAGAAPLPPQTRANVEQIVRQFQTVNNTPGVLVGIWSPKGNFVSATGVADLATGEPLRSDMQFKIASLTKPFVAVLILQLVGEGKVSLDDHISKWIAGVPNGNQVTIRELLNHTSGLGNGLTQAVIDKFDTGCSVKYLLTTQAKVPPVAKPGKKWSYSNYGYNLLGRVVELVTHQDLNTAIQRRIAKPLGLRRTLLPTSGNGLSAPFTHGYGTGETAPTQAPTAADDATSLPGSCFWAHGSMVSTLRDQRIWARALATGSLLKPAVWREAKKDPVPFEFEQNYQGPGRWKYGLGFDESGEFIGRTGSLPGYESVAYYSPAHRTTIEVVSTKIAEAWTPPPMFQALAMTVLGPHLGFGITPAQALTPNYSAGDEPEA